MQITNTHAIKIDFYNLDTDDDCTLQSVIKELDNHPDLTFAITLRDLRGNIVDVMDFLKAIFQHKNVHTINFEVSTFPYQALFDTPHIQEINIVDSTDDDLFQHLAQIIDANRNLKKIRINNKEISNHPSDINYDYFIKTLVEHPSLESIDFTKFQLSLTQLNYFLENIKFNTMIKTINLTQINAINEQFIKKTADVIFANGLPNIEQVNFSNFGPGPLSGCKNQLHQALEYAENKRQGMDVSRFSAGNYSSINFILPKFAECYDSQFIAETKKIAAENRKNKESSTSSESFCKQLTRYFDYETSTKINEIKRQLSLQGFTSHDVSSIISYLDGQIFEDKYGLAQLPPTMPPLNKWEAFLFLNEMNTILQFDGVFHEQDSNSFLIQYKNHSFLFKYGKESGFLEVSTRTFDFNPEEGFTKLKDIETKYLDGKILQKLQQLFLESKNKDKLIEHIKNVEKITNQNAMQSKLEKKHTLFSQMQVKKVKTQAEVIAIEPPAYN